MFRFRFREVHEGTVYFFDAPTVERLVHLELTVTSRGLRDFLADRIAEVEGRISIEGFAADRRLRGTVALRLVDEKRVHYEATFEADDGETYTLSCEKDVQLIALVSTMTTMPMSFFDASGAEVGRGVVHFRMGQELWPLVRSVRLLVGEA